MESRDRRGRAHVAAPVAAGLLLIFGVLYGPARAETIPGAEPATGKVELEGKLQVIVQDSQDASRTLYFLDTAFGRLSLHFNSKPPTGFLTGQDVHVRGRRTDATLEMLSGESLQALTVTMTSTTSVSTTTLPATTTLPNTLGDQKTVVLMVNFQDNSAQPWTASQVHDVVFGTVSSFMLEASYGQTSLSGDVFGWYTLPLSTTCDAFQIATDANNAATAAGVKLAAYTRLVYVFPWNSACIWSGVATIGGNPSQSWVNGGGTPTNTLDAATFAHEMGHNFGLYHSHGLDCGPVTLSGQCTVWEYFDTMDTMGSGHGHYNSFQKERLGWLNSGSSPPITTITTSGTYTIGAYEPTDSKPKALKILKFTDQTTGLSYFYYLEFRKPLGVDTSVYQTNGVVVHIATQGNPNSSDLLDMSPDSDIYSDWFDVPLVVGASYSDPDAGVVITTESANSSGATVSVSLSQPTCVRALPTISISPSQAGPVLAGTTVNYTISLRNNDSLSCGASTFNLQSTVPYGGWTGNLSTSQLTLSPGASSSTSLLVTSASNSVNGQPEPIVVTATNVADLVYGGSATVTYVVGTPLSVAVSTNQTTYTQGQSVTVTTTVTSGGSPVSSVSVALTINEPNGSSLQASLVTGSNGQASSVLKLSRKSPKGTYVASSVASTAASSARGSTTFQVQ